MPKIAKELQETKKEQVKNTRENIKKLYEFAEIHAKTLSYLQGVIGVANDGKFNGNGLKGDIEELKKDMKNLTSSVDKMEHDIKKASKKYILIMSGIAFITIILSDLMTMFEVDSKTVLTTLFTSVIRAIF